MSPRKVMPLREDDESMATMLAFMAERQFTGFVGMCLDADGAFHPIAYGVSRGDLGVAGAVMLRLASTGMGSDD